MTDLERLICSQCGEGALIRTAPESARCNVCGDVLHLPHDIERHLTTWQYLVTLPGDALAVATTDPSDDDDDNACQAPGAHHSDDRVSVYRGRATPDVFCGYHASQLGIPGPLTRP